MPRAKHPSKRRADAAAQLTLPQIFELAIGPSPRRGSAFASDAARRASWAAHRDGLAERGHSTPWADAHYGAP